MANIDYSMDIAYADRFIKDDESLRLGKLDIKPDRTERNGFVIQIAFDKCNCSLNTGVEIYSKVYHISLYDFLATLSYNDLVKFTGFTL